MRLFLLAVLLSLSVCALAQGGQQGEVLTPPEASRVPPTARKAEELESQAKTLTDAGNHAAALELRLKALVILEEALGPDNLSVARALLNVGDSHSDLAQWDKALPPQTRALGIREKNYGPTHVLTAFALNQVALSYRALGKYKDALPLQERVMVIMRNRLGGRSIEAAEAMSNLAETLGDLSAYKRAIPLNLAALNIAKNGTKNDDFVKARIISVMSSLYEDIGFLDRALTWNETAFEIYKQYGEETSSSLSTLSNKAKILRGMVRFDQSLSLMKKIVELRIKKHGDWHPETATALDNLGLSYLDFDAYDAALPIQLRALEIRQKLFAENNLYVGLSLNNISLTYVELNQLEIASKLQLKVIEIMELTYGKNHPRTAIALSNSSKIFYLLHDLKNALSHAIRALRIRQNVFGLNNLDTAMSLGGIGRIYLALGDKNNAIDFLLRSQAILNKVGGGSSIFPQVQLLLASAYQAFGMRVEEILPLRIRALMMLEAVYGIDSVSTAKARLDLAASLIANGQQEKGAALLKMAINSYQVQRSRVRMIGSLELGWYSEGISSIYQQVADALIEQGRLFEAQQVLDMLKEDEQFEFIRRASDADPRSSRIGYSATEQVWLKRYREIADQLGKLGAEQRELEKQAKLGLTPGRKQRQQAISADLKVAQAAFQSFLGQMREDLAHKGQARKVEVEEVSAQAMRESQSLIKGLGDDVALLQYFITDKRVGMLLTTPGIQLARSSDIDAKELNRKIGELRRLLQDPKSNPEAAAQELYRILMVPVAKDLDDSKIKTVMLSLDGVLRYLPFGALHDGKQYLVNRWNLPIYTSVTRNKLRELVSPEWQAAGLGVTKAWPEFKPLSGVRAEMEVIGKTAAGGFMPGEVYLDEAFTGKRLKDVGQRKFSLVHVASHFRFSPGTEVNSFLLLGDGEHLTLGDIRTQNYRFDNVDLLTLSACDTGLGGGRDEQGKEIEGFGVIAQQQGAKAVLATLWPVADKSTALLMTDFYRRRQADSFSKIEALRRSQIALQTQSQYAHPYYWAPFILMGNWK